MLNCILHQEPACSYCSSRLQCIYMQFWLPTFVVRIFLWGTSFIQMHTTFSCMSRVSIFYLHFHHLYIADSDNVSPPSHCLSPKVILPFQLQRGRSFLVFKNGIKMWIQMIPPKGVKKALQSHLINTHENATQATFDWACLSLLHYFLG